jgi:hypothetical protein
MPPSESPKGSIPKGRAAMCERQGLVSRVATCNRSALVFPSHSQQAITREERYWIQNMQQEKRALITIHTQQPSTRAPVHAGAWGEGITGKARGRGQWEAVVVAPQDADDRGRCRTRGVVWSKARRQYRPPGARGVGWGLVEQGKAAIIYMNKPA